MTEKYNDFDPDLWQQLHDRCLALRVLLQGMEAPKGISQEIWNYTFWNAYKCFKTPIKGVDEE